jgi:protein deglycase
VYKRSDIMVVILLAEGFEEIEALTVVDVLRRAEIDIKIVSALGEEKVTGRSGISVIVDCSIGDIEFDKVNAVVLPGGMPGAKNLELNKDVQKLLKDSAQKNKWIAAICAAPYVLGKAGYLNGREATCYPGFENYLGGATVKKQNVVVSNNIITSRGPGTALAFAYEIVKVLKGEKMVEKLKKDMIFTQH